MTAVLQHIYFESKQKGQMQNFSQFAQAFYYFPNQIQYYAFIPVQQSTSQVTSPISEYTLPSPTSFFYNNPSDKPSQLNQLHPYHQNQNIIPSSELTSKTQIAVSAITQTQQQGSRIGLGQYLLGGQANSQQNRSSSQMEEVSLDCVNGNKKQKIKINNIKSKNSMETQDREYLPQMDRRRKQGQKYQQNQNRNIIPNQINQIFSFIQKKNKSGLILQKLFSKFNHPSEFNPKRFYLYQSLLKNKLGHYTNQKSLKLVTELYEPKCESWPELEQRFYNKICRVLIRHFLYQDSIFIILTSKRMRSQKKLEHLRARRSVRQSALQILKGL